MANNTLHRYLFEDLSVRGELVQLDDAYQQIISSKEYPKPVQNLLGELLVATTRYLDDVHGIEKTLVKSRTATSGLERLREWVEAWGNHIPVIYGVAKALLAMKDSDEEAAAAWADRMGAVRHGCAAAVAALAADGKLTEALSQTEATDLLWTLQSVRNWEQLRHECGWSQERYIQTLQVLAMQALVK